MFLLVFTTSLVWKVQGQLPGWRADLVLISRVELSVSNLVKKVIEVVGKRSWGSATDVDRVKSSAIRSHHFPQTLQGRVKFPLSKFHSKLFLYFSLLILMVFCFIGLFFPSLRHRKEDPFLVLMLMISLVTQVLLLGKIVTIFEVMISSQKLMLDHLIISVVRGREELL